MSAEKIQSDIVSAIGPFSDFIFVLGSLGTDRFHAESDIDIAVHFKKDLDNTKRWDLQSELASKFNRDVDLVNLEKVDPIFAYQVLSVGKLIYNSNPDLLTKWKIKYISMYEDLKISRKIVEDNLLKKAKIP